MKLRKNRENIDDMLHYEGLFYLSDLTWIELISKYHNDFLTSYFEIKNTRKLVVQKNYLEILKYNIKIYVKKYDVYLLFKAVKQKLYKNL